MFNQTKIVAVIDQFYPIETIKKAYADGARVLEFRLDLFEGYPLHQTMDYLKSLKALNYFETLGTVREVLTNKMIRLECFDELFPIVDYVDIECDTPLKNMLVERSQAAGKKVVLSFHDFEKTPSNEALDALLEDAKAYNPALFKVAVMPQTHDDTVRLLEWCYANRQQNLIVMAMGDLGKYTRVVSSYFGSQFTYGFLGKKAVAPGQMTVEQLKKALLAVG